MMKKINDVILIIVGCMIAAFGTACFLLPNQLSSGGFAGIATIFYYFFNIQMGTTIIILNIPLFILGYFKLGKMFILRTCFATVLYSIFIDVFSLISPFTDDRFLASIYGGIIIGFGLALVFRANTSTGGSDLIAYIAQNYNKEITISNILVLIDVVIVILNLIAFREIEIVLYSAICIYLIGKMLDLVFEGINFSKMIYIISDKYEEIEKVISLEIKKGATGFYGKGIYKGNDKTIIMCVSKRRNIMKIKEVVRGIDNNSFVIVTDVREVYGLGFK